MNLLFANFTSSETIYLFLFVIYGVFYLTVSIVIFVKIFYINNGFLSVFTSVTQRTECAPLSLIDSCKNSLQIRKMFTALIYFIIC